MLDNFLIVGLQFGYRSYVKKPMENLKDLEWLYSKCLEGEELTPNECNLIYCLCIQRCVKPLAVLASFVFDKEERPFVSQKEYRSLFILAYERL